MQAVVETPRDPGKHRKAICILMTIMGTSCLSARVCTHLPRDESKFVVEAAGEAPGLEGQGGPCRPSASHRPGTVQQ